MWMSIRCIEQWKLVRICVFCMKNENELGEVCSIESESEYELKDEFWIVGKKVKEVPLEHGEGTELCRCSDISPLTCGRTQPLAPSCLVKFEESNKIQKVLWKEARQGEIFHDTFTFHLSMTPCLQGMPHQLMTSSEVNRNRNRKGTNKQTNKQTSKQQIYKQTNK